MSRFIHNSAITIFVKPAITAITCVLAATFLCEVGSSLLGVVQPIRGLLEGFSSIGIGALGTAYYLGFILGCLFIPRLIKRFGHIRTYSAFSAIAGSAVLLNVFFINIFAWFFLRVAFGFCMAGVFTVVESWLNELANSQTRGRILAGYMIAVWLAIVLGKLLFSIQDPSDILPFAIISMLISLSLVPVALTTGVVPERKEAVRFHPRDVYDAAPIGIVACFMIGMINGAIWSLAPIYAQTQTESTAFVGIFMAVLVLGGAFAQWPIGRLSDRVDRRLVILLSSLVAAAFGIGLAVLHQASELELFILAFGFGAATLPLYSLCVAHVNDKISSQAFVEVSGQLLLTFGLGAIIGPLIASAFISMINSQALFAYTATVHALIAGYAAWRIYWVVPVPTEEQVPFTPVPETTPLVFEMQPTTPPESEAQTDK